MSKIARKEGLKTKKIFGRDALISIGGNRPNFVEILDEYDQEGLGDDAVMTDVDRSEAIVAMKAAQWRLQLEIKKEKQQKEQLKLSLSKQVLSLCYCLAFNNLLRIHFHITSTLLTCFYTIQQCT